MDNGHYGVCKDGPWNETKRGTVFGDANQPNPDELVTDCGTGVYKWVDMGKAKRAHPNGGFMWIELGYWQFHKFEEATFKSCRVVAEEPKVRTYKSLADALDRADDTEDEWWHR